MFNFTHNSLEHHASRFQNHMIPIAATPRSTSLGIIGNSGVQKEGLDFGTKDIKTPTLQAPVILVPNL